jgi:hypothetical protein
MKHRVSGFIKSGEVSLPLDESSFKKIEAAKACCITVWEVEEKLSILLENFYEFEVELLKLAEVLVIWTNHEFIDTMQRRLSLDRRVVNLLTACRLYLDQTDYALSRLFGNPSKELEAIKLFKNKEYDNHWGYRLMEALRNHVQHAGLIVHGITHNYHAIRSESGREVNVSAVECSVIPHSTVEILAENREFKKSVLEELKPKGKDIDLRMPTREYVFCLISIHFEIRKLIESRVADARKAYESAIAEFSTHEGQQVNYPTLELLDEKGTRAREIPLVTEFLEAYDLLIKKNNKFENLPRNFASNRASEGG